MHAAVMAAATHDEVGTGPAVPPVPRLRGVLHQWAAVAAVPTGVWLVLRAAPGAPRVAITGYAAAMCAMLATSALYHRHRWSSSARRVMAGLDRCLIFVGFTAAATPWALEPGVPWARDLLLVVWGGVLAGILAQLPRMVTDRSPPTWCRVHWLIVLPYFALGTPIVVAAPTLATMASPVAGGLVSTGALVLTAGAVAYAARRPNPFPALFGHHELFHAGVLAAFALNTAALAAYLLPHP